MALKVISVTSRVGNENSWVEVEQWRLTIDQRERET